MRRKGGSFVRLAAPALFLGLAQCTSLGPYEGPPPAADQHSICYNRLAATPEQIRTLAAQTCDGKEPRPLRQSMDLSECPILIPERYSFACGPP